MVILRKGRMENLLGHLRSICRVGGGGDIMIRNSYTIFRRRIKMQQ